MAKVNWMPGNEAARSFRDSNTPGIVFKYKAAFTTEREAVALIEKLKRQGKPYRKQQRVNPEGGRFVHVVFEGVPKGQAKAGQLPSTINSPRINARILTAARKRFRMRKGLTTFYEHGHWWLRLDKDYHERTYDVVDASGPGSIDGFDFELIDEIEY